MTRVTDFLREMPLSLRLLVQRRAGLVLVVDALFLTSVLATLLIEGDSTSLSMGNDLYFTVVLPMVLLGIPVLADQIALERRAGCLDLALSAPGAGTYFERRTMALLLVMLAQGWMLMLLGRAVVGEFLLLPALLRIPFVVAFLGATVFCHACHWRSAGAATFASFLTVGAAGPWFFAAPTIVNMSEARFWTSGSAVLQWSVPNLVLAIGAVVFYLYGRRRVARPEGLLH